MLAACNTTEATTADKTIPFIRHSPYVYYFYRL